MMKFLILSKRGKPARNHHSTTTQRSGHGRSAVLSCCCLHFLRRGLCGRSILADDSRDSAQNGCLAAIDGAVCLVLRQEPHLAVAAGQALHRGLIA